MKLLVFCVSSLKKCLFKSLAYFLKKLHDVGLGSDFLDMTPKTQATKTKKDK